MSFRVIGLYGKGLAKSGGGGVQISAGSQGVTQVVLSEGVGGHEGDGLADQVGGSVVPPHLVRDHSQMMKGFGMLGLAGENLPVKPLGFRQFSDLVVL